MPQSAISKVSNEDTTSKTTSPGELIPPTIESQTPQPPTPTTTTTTIAQPVFTNAEEASRKCNQWVESGITKNKSIQFLLKTLIDSGCSGKLRRTQVLEREK